jgi:hypothetical protein
MDAAADRWRRVVHASGLASGESGRAGEQSGEAVIASRASGEAIQREDAS